MTGEVPEIFQEEVISRFQRYSPAAGARAVESLIGRQKKLPPIAVLVKEIEDWESAIESEMRRRLNPPRKREPMPGNIRNRHATAAMLRAVVRARGADDPHVAHEPILAVARSPEKWPDWLDEHGDEEWRNLPEEKKRAVQNHTVIY